MRKVQNGVSDVAVGDVSDDQLTGIEGFFGVPAVSGLGCVSSLVRVLDCFFVLCTHETWRFARSIIQPRWYCWRGQISS